MQDAPDAQLLREYAQSGNEAAFREIVARHTDLVYSAALRQAIVPELAKDISQGVFVDLARKAKAVAKQLAANASLVGWLYRSTRFAVLKHLRDNRRRVMHERQAMEQLITDCGPSQEWERICPVLDEAMAQLNDDDRDAILLRYFKNHDFRTVGQALDLSDDAAQKRVSRAVERLREFFSKRGVTIGAGGLVVLISANAVQAAPVALATSISTAATLTGTAVHTSTAIATKVIAMTTLQKTVITITLAAAIGTGIYQTKRTSHLRSEVQALQQENKSLADQLRRLQDQNDKINSDLLSLRDENERSKRAQSEALKLRNEVTHLREDNQLLAGAQQLTNPVAANQAAPSNSTNEIQLPKSSWTNAGFATPENALRTRGWAVLTGDREQFKNSLLLTDGARKLIEDMILKMGAASTAPDKAAALQEAVNNNWGAEEAILMPLMALNKNKDFTGYRILSDESPSVDERILEVETQMATAPSEKQTMKFVRVGNDWRVFIDESFVQSAR